MTDPLFILFYIFIFPGFFFLFGYALFLSYLDRKIAARMQQRVGPPFFQPLADLIKMLGKEVINPDGVDWRVFDAIPVVALAAVMTAFLYVPVIGASPLAFQGDLVVVLYLMALLSPSSCWAGSPATSFLLLAGSEQSLSSSFTRCLFFLPSLHPLSWPAAGRSRQSFSGSSTTSGSYSSSRLVLSSHWSGSRQNWRGRLSISPRRRPRSLPAPGQS